MTVLCEILQYEVHEVGLKLLHVYRQRFFNKHFGRICVCIQCNIGQLGIICMLLLYCNTVLVEVKCIGTVNMFLCNCFTYLRWVYALTSSHFQMIIHRSEGLIPKVTQLSSLWVIVIYRNVIIITANYIVRHNSRIVCQDANPVFCISVNKVFFFYVYCTMHCNIIV